jgi:2-oxoglutarate ferredoxin oxidoreductase subunit gamma
MANMTKMIFSGFGGQGILTLGEIVATIAMQKGKHVTWMPSYGAEMRGGTANCSVIVSDSVIGSPIVSTNADIVIALNSPSLDKFEPIAAPGGTIIMNTSIIKREANRGDIKVLKVDASNIAVSLGNIRVANMVALGAYLTIHPNFTDKEVEAVLLERFGERGASLIPMNMEAIKRGRG